MDFSGKQQRSVISDLSDLGQRAARHDENTQQSLGVSNLNIVPDDTLNLDFQNTTQLKNSGNKENDRSLLKNLLVASD